MGKLADLVILERNPLMVDPATIKDIAVVETIKEGRSIYRRAAHTARRPVDLLAPGRPCLHEHDHGSGGLQVVGANR